MCIANIYCTNLAAQIKATMSFGSMSIFNIHSNEWLA